MSLEKLINKANAAGKPVDQFLTDLYEQHGSWLQVAYYLKVAHPTIYKWRDKFVTDTETKIAQESAK